MRKNRDVFREMYGDDLANLVEELKRKPNGREVLKPKKQAEPPQRRDEEQQHESNWWDR